VDATPLPGHPVQDLSHRRLQPGVGVRDDQFDAREPALEEAFQEGRPGAFHLALGHGQPQDFPLSLGVHGHGHHHRQPHHAAALADLRIERIQPEVAKGPFQRAVPEGFHLRVQFLRQSGDLGLRHSPTAQGLHKRLDLPGAHTHHVGLSRHVHKGLLPASARLQKGREVAAPTQLRNGQHQFTEPRLELPLPVAVPVVLTRGRPLARRGLAEPRDVRLHHRLEPYHEHPPQEITVPLLQHLAQGLQPRDPIHGHRSLRR